MRSNDPLRAYRPFVGEASNNDLSQTRASKRSVLPDDTVRCRPMARAMAPGVGHGGRPGADRGGRARLADLCRADGRRPGQFGAATRCRLVRRSQGIRRDPRPRPCRGGPALRPVQGHHPLHLAHDERGGSRDLLARAALLDRLARQQLRRRHGAQAEPRHVGFRHAERHGARGTVAVARRAPWRDVPVRLALAADGTRRRHRHRPLRGDHGEAVARLRYAGDAAFQCVGQPPGRRAGRRGELQSRRQGVRRGGPRGRALWPGPGALADAHMGHLDAGPRSLASCSRAS